MINYGKQTITKIDKKSVLEALKSDYLTTGPKVKEFENKLIKKFGGKYCCVVNNGTSALLIVGKVLGWKKGDKIITTPLSFLATANCIVQNNATPVFVDVENKTFTIDPQKLEDKLKKRHYKAVIAVDYGGHPCDWPSLKYLSKKYNFTLINDACHSIGSKYKNNIKYACYYADYVTHSYHPVKTITTGEGGSIFCKDKLIAEKIYKIRNHSMERNLRNEPWYYEIHEAGSNFRITDFQCALGISQLKNLGKFVDARRKIASIYKKELKNDERFILPLEKKHFFNAYHIFPLQINFNSLNINKIEMYNKFKKKGINLQVHYIPIHLQPFYRKKYNYKKNQFLNAETFYKQEFSLPIYPTLKMTDLYKVIKELRTLK